MKSLNSFINNLISWFYIIGTIALGSTLILAVSGMYGVKESIELTINEQLNSPSGIWTGLILSLLGILFFSLRVKEGITQKSVSFANTEGEVTITIRAIEDFIKRVSQEFAQVVEVTPTIISTKEGIKIKAKSVLIAGSHVPRLAEGLQHTIKNRMQTILGIENVTAVEIHISKLITKKGSQEEPGQQTLGIG